MSIVWQISVVSYPNKTTVVSGMLLKRKPALIKSDSGVFRSFRSVLASYFYLVENEKRVQVMLDNTQKTAELDRAGRFTVMFPEIEASEVTVRFPEKTETLPIVQNYPLFFGRSNSSFDVISDIDDTIVKSYTADVAKRITTILFKRPAKRKPVEFTKRLFQELEKFDPAIYFVSKSESNLFHLLTSVIKIAGLPRGTLFLTPYLKWYQLFKPKKGQNYKYDTITRIIHKSAEKNFILMGDDTQRDMDVYTRIVSEYPQRIIHVYIRQTRLRPTFLQKQKWKKLLATGVQATYFTEEDEFKELPKILLKEAL